MADESKTYSITGAVTIGADEYRELIETATALKCELNSINELNEAKIEKLKSEMNHYYDHALKNGEEVDSLRKEIRTLNHYKDFITTDEARHQAFKEWEENNG